MTVALEVHRQHHRGWGPRWRASAKIEKVLAIHEVPLCKDSSGIAPLKDNRTLHANPKGGYTQSSIWINMDERGQKQHPHTNGTPFPSIPEIKVTCEGVRKLLQKLTVGQICYQLECWRNKQVKFTTSDSHISEKLGYWLCTKNWRAANVTAIFKKGRNSRLATTGQYLSCVFAAISRSMWSPVMP